MNGEGTVKNMSNREEVISGATGTTVEGLMATVLTLETYHLSDS